MPKPSNHTADNKNANNEPRTSTTFKFQLGKNGNYFKDKSGRTQSRQASGKFGKDKVKKIDVKKPLLEHKFSLEFGSKIDAELYWDHSGFSLAAEAGLLKPLKTVEINKRIDQLAGDELSPAIVTELIVVAKKLGFDPQSVQLKQIKFEGTELAINIGMGKSLPHV